MDRNSTVTLFWKVPLATENATSPAGIAPQTSVVKAGRPPAPTLPPPVPAAAPAVPPPRPALPAPPPKDVPPLPSPFIPPDAVPAAPTLVPVVPAACDPPAPAIGDELPPTLEPPSGLGGGASGFGRQATAATRNPSDTWHFADMKSFREGVPGFRENGPRSFVPRVPLGGETLPIACCRSSRWPNVSP